LVNWLSLLLVPLKLEGVVSVVATARDVPMAGARGTRSVGEKVWPDNREPLCSIRVAPVARRAVLGTIRATPAVPL
jgi:hypothetical protein